jgi:hypothetical protein
MIPPGRIDGADRPAMASEGNGKGRYGLVWPAWHDAVDDNGTRATRSVIKGYATAADSAAGQRKGEATAATAAVPAAAQSRRDAAAAARDPQRDAGSAATQSEVEAAATQRSREPARRQGRGSVVPRQAQARGDRAHAGRLDRTV